MNDWLVRWGIEAWKPWLQLLAVPPVPLLLAALLAWVMLPRWPRVGRALGLVALLALWLVSTPWAAHRLTGWLTRPPPPLSADALARLQGAPHTAIVVLGAGRRALAPEYGGPDLATLTIERVRYAAWLARRSGLPLAYTGGIGHGAGTGATEAEAARQALARDQGPALRWMEERSRDTAESARFTVALLQADGIRRIVLVTHEFHQQRSLAAFRRAIDAGGRPMELVPAPVAVRTVLTGIPADFVPSGAALQRSAWALHEWLGWLAGA